VLAGQVRGDRLADIALPGGDRERQARLEGVA
jgi:hypothetical protein